jgi:DNA-binding beta-propeller fold protein YncE
MRRLIAGVLMGLALAGAAQAAAPCPYAAGAATLEVPGRPFMAVASADGCWLFVSLGPGAGKAGGGGGLAVLRNAAGAFRLAGVTPVKNYPGGLAISHDGATLAVATEANVTLFDVARLEAGGTDAQVSTVPVGAGAIYVAISRDDRLMFVSEERMAQLSVIDLAKARTSGADARIGVVVLARAPVGLALSADGTRLYATSESVDRKIFPADCEPEMGDHGQHPEGMLSVIDVGMAAKDPAKAVVAVRRAGCNPVRVALSADQATVWVTARGEHRLKGFSALGLSGASTAAPDISVKVGQAPIGIAVRPDGTQVWVADSNRFGHNRPGELTALSPSGKVLRTVATGVFPRDINFLPDGKTLVVAQYESQAVQFVPTDAP